MMMISWLYVDEFILASTPQWDLQALLMIARIKVGGLRSQFALVLISSKFLYRMEKGKIFDSRGTGSYSVR